eukprot:TRINITY_DN7522_c0_g2_i7.p1 TRINITY_DN7522_c0_g2~~TRINITY_DN7522_c0_g2_i7.p1  ORF type:complete len:562 (+),score=104.71 TRINITY_DN7522_c0_g2_i7:163-1848(+)
MHASGVLPLERRISEIQTLGIREAIPDLSPKWVTPLSFLPYFPEDNDSSEVVEILNESCEELLCMSYKNFWSQVVHDPTFLKFFDTYLRYCRRDFDMWFQGNTETLSEARRGGEQKKLFQNIFRIILRMSQDKENPQDFMSPDFFGKLIYDNHIFDIPKILDICSLYSNYSTDQLRVTIRFLFSIQPQFQRDLDLSVTSVKTVFCELRKKMYKNPSRTDFDEISSYLKDIAFSLYFFFSDFPPAILRFVRAGFLDHFTLTYDTIMTKFRGNLEQKISEKLCHCWLLLGTKMMNFLLDLIEGNVSAEDDFFSLAEGSCSQQARHSEVGKIFSSAMGSLIGVCRGLDIDPSEGPYPPENFGNFVRELTGTMENFHQRLVHLRDEISPGVVQNVNWDLLVSDFFSICGNAALSEISDQSKEQTLSCEFLSKVSKLGEIFRGQKMSDGFLAICLKHFGSSEEETLHHLLEDDLPPHIQRCDRQISMDMAKMVLGCGGKRVDKSSFSTIFDGTELDLISVNSKINASFIVGGLVDSRRFAAKERWLEQGLGCTETFISNSDDLTIR